MDINSRKIALKKLKMNIESNIEGIYEALKKDFNKCKFDTYTTEVGLVLEELSHTLSHVKRWAKPRRAATSLKSFPSKGRILFEPFGEVLVISPWNYPFLLTFMPIVGAIGAGNNVTIKPSAKTANTSKIIEKIVSDIGCITFTNARDILENNFDFIFFTGGAQTGRMIMEKAAKNLTPVALELGGKSPCIVDSTADIARAAKRIAWAKFLNAGQTCVAPDYLMVHESVYDEFIKKFTEEIKLQYYIGDTLSEDFPFLINRAKGEEMQQLLSAEKIVFGGRLIGRLLEPTVVEANISSPLLKEEIFAPVAPIIKFKDISEVKTFVSSRPKPLALYYFGKSDEVIEELSFGGGVKNDAVMHVAEGGLPFGGVGQSGMGRYHGIASFETFSHQKSVLYRGKIDFRMRFAPHSEKYFNQIKKIIK